jgi:hypothetical protein
MCKAVENKLIETPYCSASLNALPSRFFGKRASVPYRNTFCCGQYLPVLISIFIVLYIFQHSRYKHKLKHSAAAVPKKFTPNQRRDSEIEEDIRCAVSRVFVE